MSSHARILRLFCYSSASLCVAVVFLRELFSPQVFWRRVSSLGSLSRRLFGWSLFRRGFLHCGWLSRAGLGLFTRLSGFAGALAAGFLAGAFFAGAFRRRLEAKVDRLGIKNVLLLRKSTCSRRPWIGRAFGQHPMLRQFFQGGCQIPRFWGWRQGTARVRIELRHRERC